MLREAEHVHRRKPVHVRKDKRTGRFRIERLEERIAPAGGHVHSNACSTPSADNTTKCGG
jgi:hypothetical protein